MKIKEIEWRIKVKCKNEITEVEETTMNFIE